VGGSIGHKSYDLKHVVLDDIADRPGGVVKLTPLHNIIEVAEVDVGSH